MQNNSSTKQIKIKSYIYEVLTDPDPLLKADESFQLLLKQHMHVFDLP